GGPSEGSSETGSDAKTQGHRSAKKPLRLRISCGFAKEFERANKARARRKPSWDEKSRYGFLFARTSIANRPRRLTSGGMLARWHIHIVFQGDPVEIGNQGFDAQVPAAGIGNWHVSDVPVAVGA